MLTPKLIHKIVTSELNTSVLQERISQHKQVERFRVVLRLHELYYLAPLFRHSLKNAKSENQFQKTLVTLLLCENVDYDDLIDAYEGLDGTPEDVEKFVFQAECVAGIEYCAADDEDDKAEMVSMAKRCDKCFSGFRLFALSVAVLIEPLPIGVAMDIAHESSQFEETYARLMRSLVYITDVDKLP